jgi:tetratricopeptide (TPR) repeat protein
VTFAVKPSLRVVTGSFGAGLMLAGVVLPWFQCPAAVSEAVIGGREPRAAFLFKVLCLGFVVASGLRVWRGVGSTRGEDVWVARAAAALFGVLLFFPHVVMIWCPISSGQARWLHTLHESLTWFGGDVFGLQEAKDFAWKGRVVVADVLDEATALSLPTWGPGAAPFGSLRAMAEWFGYSGAFCQFARIGWGLELLGTSLVFLYGCRGLDRRATLDAVRAGAASGAGVVALGASIALVPAALSATELDRARDAAEHGLYAVALDRLETSVTLLPVLAESSDLAVQRGLLENRLGEETTEASLYRAKVLQGLGRLDEADALFGHLAGSGAPPAVGREAERALLRRGIRELNSGETANAIETLQGVLANDPCNVKANYVLQLAYLRARRFEEVVGLAGQMRAIYRLFRDQTKLSVLAATEENVAYSEYLRDNPAAASAAWQTLGDAKRLEQ